MPFWPKRALAREGPKLFVARMADDGMMQWICIKAGMKRQRMERIKAEREAAEEFANDGFQRVRETDEKDNEKPEVKCVVCGKKLGGGGIWS